MIVQGIGLLFDPKAIFGGLFAIVAIWILLTADITNSDATVHRPEVKTQAQPQGGGPQLPPPPKDPPPGIDPGQTVIVVGETARRSLELAGRPDVTRRVIYFRDGFGKVYAQFEQNKVPIRYLLDDVGDYMVWQSKLTVSSASPAGYGTWYWKWAERSFWFLNQNRVVIDLSTTRYGTKGWTTRHFPEVVNWLQQYGEITMLYSQNELGVWVFRNGALLGSMTFVSLQQMNEFLEDVFEFVTYEEVDIIEVDQLD